MAQTFYVIRHGETQFNAEQRLQGHCNSPLTARGQQQAKNVGLHLKHHLADQPFHFYCSSLGRAVETAHLIGQQLTASAMTPATTPTQDDRLKEFNLGEWEQRTIPSLIKEQPNLLERADWYLQAPACEAYIAVQRRLLDWLSTLPKAGNIVVVTHGLTGTVLRGLLLDLSYDAVWQQAIPQDAFFKIVDGQVTRIDCPTLQS